MISFPYQITIKNFSRSHFIYYHTHAISNKSNGLNSMTVSPLTRILELFHNISNLDERTIHDLIKKKNSSRHPDNWILCTRRYNEVTLIKLPRASKRRRSGEKWRKEKETSWKTRRDARGSERRDETAHKAEGVIESGAVIQSSQDAVMKLPLSSILSAWHGQLPAPPELSKKLCCISD